MIIISNEDNKLKKNTQISIIYFMNTFVTFYIELISNWHIDTN